ncbi:MAG: serine hydrolase [Pseudobutyrivibrio sp.]|nr:serine hydrolase [Pseudobutyrivibrio sp.]
MSRYRRNMSDYERRAYRRRKKLIRKIQVYAEITVITLAIIVVGGLIISHFKSNDDTLTLAAEETQADKEKGSAEESTGLKISAAKTEAQEPAEEEKEPEETKQASGNYSAKETESTVEIGGEVVSEYAILINNDTKEIVGKRNANEKIVPASMTKVMTVLVAAKHISAEQLDEVVTMSHDAIDYSYAGGGSTSGFVEDEEVTVKDLFYGTILPSGGDAAAQLAMYVAGDIDTFVGMMNEEAANLGLTNTHFTNPVGFHSSEHYSTPYDISIIMMAALDNELCREVLTTKVYNSTGTNINPDGITISNWFLRRIEDKDIGGEILGAKTGYVDESGNCAVSSMTSASGVEYICCTAKSSSSWRCIYDHVDIYKTYAK